LEINLIEKSLLARNAGLKVRSFGTPFKPRQIECFTGMASSKAASAFAPCLINLVNAVLLRVLTKKTVEGVNTVRKYITDLEPQESVVRATFAKFKADLISLLPVAAPILREKFHELYVGRKGANYRLAFQEWLIRGSIETDAHIKVFLKFEKFVQVPGKIHVPRCISPPHRVFLQETGRYIRSVEHKIYEKINQLLGYECVAKGMNYDKLAQNITGLYHNLADPVTFDIDIEKMDQSIWSSILQFTHDIVGSCFYGDERMEIMELLEKQLYSYCSAKTNDGSVSYQVKGTLTSGQQNTALVGVLVAIGVSYPVLVKYVDRVFLVDMGDDMLFMTEREISNDVVTCIKRNFSRINMNLTIEGPHYEIEDMEFCQLKFVFDGIRYRSCRNPHKVMLKDLTCIDPLVSDRSAGTWMRSVGKGGLASHGGLPIFDSFYRMLIRNGEKLEGYKSMTKKQQYKARRFRLEKEFNDFGAGVDYLNMTVSDDARCSFWKAFGIVPASQKLIELHFDQLVISRDRLDIGSLIPGFILLG